MIFIKNLNKKSIENYVFNIFQSFGSNACLNFLDSLKFIGYKYATFSGLSIGINEFKIPNLKSATIKNIQENINILNKKSLHGFLLEDQKYQLIFDQWNIFVDDLKTDLLDYFEKFDFGNSLYIIAFSGARGNFSQIQQILGARGLMSSYFGDILKSPILNNLFSGLSNSEYITSAHGARKGLIDTSIKTADSGYITRRLIFLCRDIQIRDTDCNTNYGLLCKLDQFSNLENFYGKFLKYIFFNFRKKIFFQLKNTIISYSIINQLYDILSILDSEQTLSIKIKCPIICELKYSVCQNCFGWDLSSKNLIRLGSTIGIVAAQSIGEPGTQMTMRTFHTGGTYSSSSNDIIVSKNFGKYIIPFNLSKSDYFLSNHIELYKTTKRHSTFLINWTGSYNQINIESDYILYITKSVYIDQNDILSEIYYYLDFFDYDLFCFKAKFSGQILYNDTTNLEVLNNNIDVNINSNQLNVLKGDILKLPLNSYNLLYENFKINQKISFLKIYSPFKDFLFSKNKNEFIFYKNKFKINLSTIRPRLENCFFELNSIIKNFNFIDFFTVIAYIYIFSYKKGKIYSIDKKKYKNFQLLFIVTESDIWKFSSDQFDNNLNFSESNFLNKNISTNSLFNKSLFLLNSNGFSYDFQLMDTYFINKSTILNYYNLDLVHKDAVLGATFLPNNSSSDITQGLPKIELLLDIFVMNFNNNENILLKPGIFYNNLNIYNILINKDKTLFEYFCFFSEESYKSIIQSPIFYNENKNCFFNNFAFSLKLLNIYYVPIELSKDIFYLYSKNKNSNLLKLSSKSFKNNAVMPNNLKNSSNSHYNNDYDNFFSQDEENEEAIFTKEYDMYDSFDKEFFDYDETSNSIDKNQANDSDYNNDFDQMPVWNLIDTFDDSIFFYKKNNFTDLIKIDKNFSTNYKIFKNSENNDLVVPLKNFGYAYLKNLDIQFLNEANTKIITQYKDRSFFNNFKSNLGLVSIYPDFLLSRIFDYHIKFDGIFKALKKSVIKFRIIYNNSLQSIYEDQNINIGSVHTEIIVRELTNLIKITSSSDTSKSLSNNDLVSISTILSVCKAFAKSNLVIKMPIFKPKVSSLNNSLFSSKNFLSSATYQESKSILTNSAVFSKKDWVFGLKENVITGKLLLAGSSLFNHKTYLDNIYLFKQDYIL